MDPAKLGALILKRAGIRTGSSAVKLWSE